MSTFWYIVLSVYAGSVLSNMWQAWQTTRVLLTHRGHALLRLLPTSFIWPIVTGFVVGAGLVWCVFYAGVILIRTFVEMLRLRDAITKELFLRLLHGLNK